MKMMKMIKMMVVLVLSCVLCVSADILHEDLAINGCSASDGEVMYSLDGEEKWYADFINKRGVEPQPSFIDHMSYREGTYEQAVANQQICRQNLKVDLEAYKNPPLELDPPSSPMIYTKDYVEVGQKNVLICHVTGFYPAPVNVSWTKNGVQVTEGTSINIPYPNKDGSFRQTSRLEFVPQQGDMYSCTVRHRALDQPLTRIWDVEVKQPGVGPAVFCGLGLTVGLLGVAAGTFFLIKGNECS
uniref:HLA class II histocompatibility antigen, DP alpha 1 chain-like n=1 Tax=Scatophagus argus TaxID=75038 RepID=UPI001ED7F9D1|nr:HLA class II histocompatibility antigen, DP alpha 1 chain-like [Scatophagus argus]